MVRFENKEPSHDDFIEDWVEEYQSLRKTVEVLSESELDYPTSSKPWSIRHQIGHLLWTDQMLLAAIEDAGEFGRQRERLAANITVAINESAYAADSYTLAQLLQQWSDCLRQSVSLVGRRDLGEKIPWFGPPMRLRTAVSARIMELFAHGQDIRDALGISPLETDRLWYVGDLAVRTRRFSFHINDVSYLDDDVRVVLEFQNGLWTWGPDDAENVVRGPAVDFALLACQRRNRKDLRITAEGTVADQWLSIIQAFAGPPGPGRPPFPVA